MSSGLFKNVIYKLYIYKSYMYKENLALNNLQWLICHKSQPNQTKTSLLAILVEYTDGTPAEG